MKQRFKKLHFRSLGLGYNIELNANSMQVIYVFAENGVAKRTDRSETTIWRSKSPMSDLSNCIFTTLSNRRIEPLLNLLTVFL